MLRSELNKYVQGYTDIPYLTPGDYSTSILLKKNIRAEINLIFPNIMDYVLNEQK